jgi:4-hydroxysphinganine ceramide fatty acyl 2-hydroxylase
MSTTTTMPGRTLPTIPVAEVRSHNNEKSCYVTIGAKVYDVTDFLDAHPGGGDLILEYAGQDVEAILKDEISHAHSDAAYEILDESLVGFMPTESLINGATKSSRPTEMLPLLPTAEGTADLKSMTENGKPLYMNTGMSSAEDLSKDTDPDRDYKEHKFLDLSKPLLLQVWFGGFSKDFYLEQVHRPRHYNGGASAPLFGNFLEPVAGRRNRYFLCYGWTERTLPRWILGFRIGLLDYYRIRVTSLPVPSRRVGTLNRYTCQADSI